MMHRIQLVGLSLVVALATSGCAQTGQLLTDLDTRPKLEAWGPGTVFPSIETAAVDALIYSVDGGYSYGEIHVASRLLAYKVEYPLKQQDVARFHMYPLATNRDVMRNKHRASHADLRSVVRTDPLHRPLFILHSSLVIREYRGKDDAVVVIADLRRPKRVILVAGESGTGRVQTRALRPGGTVGGQ